MEELIIQMAITTILSTVKNKAKKKQLRAAMLEIFNAIRLAYAGDKDFQ